MSEPNKNRLLRPETLTALGIIIVASFFWIPSIELRPISALLPAAMLIGLIGLSALLLVSDQRKARAGTPPAEVMKSPKRVIGAFVLIVAYAVAVDFVGFYISTAITIPLVAYVFGFRNPLGLAMATVIVVGAVWLVFDFSMSRDFPAGRLWLN